MYMYHCSAVVIQFIQAAWDHTISEIACVSEKHSLALVARKVF